MGDQFRKQQIGNVKKGRDKAQKEADAPTLGFRQDHNKTIYQVQIDQGRELVVGEKLHVHLPELNGPVVVARAYERIGFIDGEASEVLRKALTDPMSDSIAQLRILSIEEISGDAKAEILENYN